MSLQEKLKTLPSSPGVYLMKDSMGHIIYVGKSKNLKKRVPSYFQNSKAHTPKMKKLAKNIKNFELILTDTEFEALMLECQFIQEYKPLFNRKMKNPLSYSYIVIHPDEKWRKVEITHSPTRHDGTILYGPYTSRSTVERAIQGIKDGFKISCSHSSITYTACLNYSLGQCLGMCLGGEALEYYNQIINKMVDLLSGTDFSLLDEMKQKMANAAESLDFETAAKYRDYIDSITFLIHKEEVIDFTKEHQQVAVSEQIDDQTIKIFILSGNKILFREKYRLENIEVDHIIAAFRTELSNHQYTKVAISPEKVSRYEIDQAQIIYSYLNSSSCKYIIIAEKWLETENDLEFDQALRELLVMDNSHDGSSAILHCSKFSLE